MTQLIGRTTNGTAPVVISETALGKGGEGSVYTVTSHDLTDLPAASTLVAKIYHAPEEGNRGRKIAAMLTNPPTDAGASSVAWPLALLFTPNKQFVGYLMVKLESENYRQWVELASTKDRRRTSPNFSFMYALAACRNLAVALHSIHHAGHRVGDVNESNIFVKSDASVLIVDTDSAQITTPHGDVTFPCEVGKPEFTAPELSHGSLREQARTEATDVFAYAVAVFQMLTGGAHPTDGVYLPDDDTPDTVARIRAGALPTLTTVIGYKPSPRIASSEIPSRIRSALLSSLSVSPQARPSMESWITALDDVIPNLTQCSREANHYWDNRDASTCPWCARVAESKPEPWSATAVKPAVKHAQKSLPAVTFSSNTAPPPTARRAPLGSSAAPAATTYQGASTPAYSGGSGSGTSSSNGAPARRAFNPGHPAAPGSGGPSATASTPPAPQAAPTAPRKIKGKYVVHYADGTYGPRPPLKELFRISPKMAVTAFKEETPLPLRAWWTVDRPLGNPVGLAVGLFVVLALASSWTPLLLWVQNTFMLVPTGTARMYIPWLGLLSSAGVSIGGIMMFFSGILTRSKTKKQYGTLDGVKKESMPVTAVRFLPLWLTWGPVMVVIGGFVVLTLAFKLVGAIAREERQNNARRYYR